MGKRRGAVESLVTPSGLEFESAYAGRRVFVTGHTGFKGSWLSEWLLSFGAHVTGYSLPPPTEPSLFVQLGLEQRLEHIEADIRDLPALKTAIADSAPDFVFHLAAQPLVRLSYAEPVETYAVNVIGTVNVLEALRSLGKRCAAVMITTDKCYENREWVHGYREEDPLGGHDPYSSSKAAAEIAISAYRRSFFSDDEAPVAVASARAGNVIGGGDWALDRIVPDCMRSLAAGEPIGIRNPSATRPWQHVLEPLSGYLTLGAALSDAEPRTRGQAASAFNFGPGLEANRPVSDLVAHVLRAWPGTIVNAAEARAPHEAHLLNLATDKAFHLLGWEPAWNFEEAVAKTVHWYREAANLSGRADEIAELTRAQIRDYESARRPAKEHR